MYKVYYKFFKGLKTKKIWIIGVIIDDIVYGFGFYLLMIIENVIVYNNSISFMVFIMLKNICICL